MKGLVTGLWLLSGLLSLAVEAHGLAVSAQDAHQHSQVKPTGTAHYLGNEGLLIEHQGIKILFDPFFHRDFGIYQTVPESLKRRILSADPPFDGIHAIVISHAHEDHFNAGELKNYLLEHNTTQLFAPQQAVSEIEKISANGEFQILLSSGRLHGIALAFGQMPWQASVGELTVDAVRIPHAGWPARREVENMVFRVSTPGGMTVMHMGDADPDVDHYLPFREHWNTLRTNMAFPPYWFYQRLEGRDILDSYLNVDDHVGVHVPVRLPEPIRKGGYDVFHRPGETRVISIAH